MKNEYIPTKERQAFLMQLGFYCLVEDPTQPDGFNMTRPNPALCSNEEWQWLHSGYMSAKNSTQLIKNA